MKLLGLTMKKKSKKSIKAPQRSLPSYIEEFALLLRKKAQGPIKALPAKSPSSKPVSTVVEQIALILRKQAQKKAVKSKAKIVSRPRKTRRVKK